MKVDKKARRSKNIEDRRPGSLHLRMKVYGDQDPDQALKDEISRKMDQRMNNGKKTQIKAELKRQHKANKF